MRLPASSASYEVHTRYGRYVARRLKRAGRESLAKDAEKATLAVRVTGRVWEDSDDPVQEALADRDAADDSLDLTAQMLRITLIGRSVGAERREPYTMIFPHGLSYYTAAPLDDEEARYGELRLRLERHLPDNDEARLAAVTAIGMSLKEFTTALTALREAQAHESIAGTAARSAIQAFHRQMEKIYGALVVELGKTEADRFFPKPRTTRVDEDLDPLPPTG